MTSIPKIDFGHTFSIELNSKYCVKRFAMPNECEDKVLIEGFLGEIKELTVVEGVMLKITGVNGILRLDLKEEELRKLLQPSINEAEKQSVGGS
jgi:hypothetical protein